MPAPPDAGALPFDVDALGRYLAAHLPGFEGPLAVTQFEGGQSNPTYKLTTPSRTYVMRSKPGPAAALLPSAHAVEREFAVMRALRATAVPVPEVMLLCEDEGIVGRAFFIMEHVVGRIFWKQDLQEQTVTERGAIYDEMNRVIAALHGVDPIAVGLEAFGKAGSYFERQIGRWTKQYLASVTAPIAAMDALIAWLPQNLPAGARDDAQVRVVHGDFRMDNLIFHPTAPRVLAVLDWELSTLGHPLADFSYHCLSWHIPPGAFRGIGGLDLAALGIPAERAYVEAYCRRTGRTDVAATMAEWRFYLAYNLFRLAAILQGVAKRVELGTAASARAKETAQGARPLAELGWRIAQAS